MLNRLPAIACAAILAAALSVPAFAQSTSTGMSHDTMKHSATSSDSMKHHATMSHDTMGKDTMSHDTMKHDTTPKSQ
jgi:pentapeptide MXKDX repeat protein